MKVKKLKFPKRKGVVCKRCEKILTTEVEKEWSLCFDCYEKLHHRPRLIETPDLPHPTPNHDVYFVDDLYCVSWRW